MCDLCDDLTRNSAEFALRTRANELERFAVMLRRMASGEIKPHTNNAKIMLVDSHSIIRFLVEEFM
jgi:hypothetical protein